MPELRGRVAVLTGASSGIGRELALLLAERGTKLVLSARREERLRELAEQIAGKGGDEPLVIACDVGDPDQVERLRDRVEERWKAADMLVNNAGRGVFMPFDRLDPSTAKRVVDTNLMGVIYCTRAFLPRMLARGRGHLVFISSVLGELPAPRHAVYGATKFAVTGLAESLDYELGDRGIDITLVEPGLVRTEFAEVSGTPPERFDQVPNRSAAAVAADIVRAIERGHRRCVPDRTAHLGILFRRHFPRAARWLFGMGIRRMYGK